jgi:hypothetical protein
MMSKSEAIPKVGYYGTSEWNVSGYLPVVYCRGMQCVLSQAEYPEYKVYTTETEAKTAADNIIRQLQQKIELQKTM